MTASKYEINHSPVHLIMSGAATTLGEAAIYIFSSCHGFRVESLLQSKEGKRVDE